MDQGIDLNADDLMWAVFVLPPVISLINQKNWRDEVRGLVALGACLVYALVVTLIRGDLDWTQWREVVLQVMAGAFGAYKLFWKPSKICPVIEEATTIRKPPEYTWVTDSGDGAASPDSGDQAGP